MPDSAKNHNRERQLSSICQNQMFFCVLSGWAVTYVLTKIGKPAFFTVGSYILLMEFLHEKEFVCVDWRRICTAFNWEMVGARDREASGSHLLTNSPNGGCDSDNSEAIEVYSHTGSCGDTTSAKVSYFRYINGRDPLVCTNTIRLINRNICQVRLDFISLGLANPDDTTGECTNEKFSVANSPVICGYNSGQHMYIQTTNLGVNVRKLDLTITRALNLPTSEWTVKVTQLHCPGTNAFNLRNQLPVIVRDFPLLAPEGCTQYYTSGIDTFRSFGYNVRLNSIYSRPLKYAICFKRTIATNCIKFSVVDIDLNALDSTYIVGQTTPRTQLLPNDDITDCDEDKDDHTKKNLEKPFHICTIPFDEADSDRDLILVANDGPRLSGQLRIKPLTTQLKF
ncbi:hypothetical protein FQR65_LT04532 [Abscondita terminalis]|nr:hypothetical protein FQR65_LT04532 [Abscondita terminalis]